MRSNLLEFLNLPEAATDGRLPGDEGERLGPAERIVAALFRGADLLRQLLGPDSSRNGASGTRLAALKIIGDAAPAGCSQSELAARLQQSESSISGLVSRMRADGLLYRLRSKHDQRKRVLLVSEPGRQLLARCEASRRRQTGIVLSRLDADLLQRLTDPLERLVGELSRLNEQMKEETRRGEAGGNGSLTAPDWTKFGPVRPDEEPTQLSA